ncbi:MAG: hypothetical protein PHO70_01160 [Candidatus Omnitrophica bacterium]|nr:hypothetical protein [Candidatus Omnitrophota bacterium]
MLNRKSSLLLFLAVCFLSLTTFVYAGRGDGIFYNPPQPRLVAPYPEKVDLSGKDYLEFKWIIIDSYTIRNCEFRLYKGYEMYEKNLILKQNIDSDTSSFKVESKVFEEGEVYTWSLKAVSYGGQKSDKSFDSFTVIKK